MSKIENLISALLPTFKKDRVTEDLRITRGEVTELIPIYQQAEKLLGHWKFKDEDVKEKFATFRRIVGGKNSDNPIVHIAKHLHGIEANINQVEELATRALSENVAAGGITYKQASILKYTDALYLVTRYARRLLDYVYVMETAKFEDSGTDPKAAIPAPDLKWLNDSLVDFCHAYLAVTEEPDRTLAAFELIPDVEVARGNADTLRATIGQKKIDPLGLGFIASNYNPIYFVRMQIAEWQVRRHKSNKEELALISLRKLNLDKLSDGKHDAKVQQQIEFYEGRSQKLRYEIAEMEGQYA